MQTPAVEIVVRVHDTSRPVRRAVSSVLEYPQAGAVVVAHGLSPDALDLPKDPRIRIVHEPDGLGFPGVASNAGFQACKAEYVGLLDSDDFYEPDAISIMYRHALEDGADVVLAPLRLEGERSLLPLTIRSRKLQAARDRLFYCTAPRGLIRRTIMQDPDFRFVEDVRVGEDMRVSARLWTTDLNISYHYGDPCYVLTDDADQRVTLERRSAAESLAALNALLDEPWVRTFPPETRESLATKLLRIHILGPAARADADYWTPETVDTLASTTRKLAAFSASALENFTQKDAHAITALASGSRKRIEAALSRDRAKAGLQERLLPRNPLRALATEANLRNVIDAFIARLRHAAQVKTN